MVVWMEASLASESGACLTAIGPLSEPNLLSNGHHRSTRLQRSNRTAQAVIITLGISGAVDGKAKKTPRRI